MGQPILGWICNTNISQADISIAWQYNSCTAQLDTAAVLIQQLAILIWRNINTGGGHINTAAVLS